MNTVYFNGARLILEGFKGIHISELLEQIRGLEVMEGDWSRLDQSKCK